MGQRSSIFSYINCFFSLVFRRKVSASTKMVSNLVLSYVKDPLFTLREMWRTFKKEKKDSRLQFEASSGAFLRYTETTFRVSRTAEEIVEARMVLRDAGLIKYKESEGFYRFFSESQIEDLLRDIGCDDVKVFPRTTVIRRTSPSEKDQFS